MGYRLERKNIDLSNRRLNKIMTNDTGTIYRLDRFALKIYADNFDKEKVLDEDTARSLSKVTTHRILLPRRILFYNDRMSGFTLRLIGKKGIGKRTTNVKKEDLLNEISTVEDDVDALSKRGVLLNGLLPENTVYNGELHIIDPTLYSMIDLDNETIKRLNLYQLHLLLGSLITQDLRKEQVRASEIKQVESILELREEDTYPSDFLDLVLGNSSDIREFVKKI